MRRSPSSATTAPSRSGSYHDVGIGIVLEGVDGKREIDTATIIDTYAHGHIFHGSNQKAGTFEGAR